MKKFFLLCMSAALLVACNNDKKTADEVKTSETSSSTSSKSGDNKIVFTVDGKSVETSGWNIGYFDFGTGTGKNINITSNMHDEPRTINFNINGDQPGTYTISSGLDAQKRGIAYGAYHADFKNDLQNAFSFESGEIIIQSIDKTALTLNATFQGTAKNAKGETVTITDGKVINGKLKL